MFHVSTVRSYAQSAVTSDRLTPPRPTPVTTDVTGHGLRPVVTVIRVPGKARAPPPLRGRPPAFPWEFLCGSGSVSATRGGGG